MDVTKEIMVYNNIHCEFGRFFENKKKRWKRRERGGGGGGKSPSKD